MTLIVRWKKGRNGPHTLICTRADGSSTMQRTAQSFFPLHDLMHFAVETVLGHRRGFYGLLASGWDIGDFGTPWPRGPLPSDVDPSELIVGQLDLERATGVKTNAAAINEHVRAWLKENAPAQSTGDALRDADLDEIRALAARLHERWRVLQPGESMQLEFPPGSDPTMEGRDHE